MGQGKLRRRFLGELLQERRNLGRRHRRNGEFLGLLLGRLRQGLLLELRDRPLHHRAPVARVEGLLLNSEIVWRAAFSRR